MNEFVELEKVRKPCDMVRERCESDYNLLYDCDIYRRGRTGSMYLIFSHI